MFGFLTIQTACNNSNYETLYYDFETDYFKYEIPNHIMSYDITSDGRLYCSSIEDQSAKTISNSNDVQNTFTTPLLVLNESGDVEERYELEGSAAIIQIDEIQNLIYYVDTMDEKSNKIKVFNIESTQSDVIVEMSKHMRIEQLDVGTQSLFVYGNDISLSENGITNHDSENQFIGRIDLQTKQFDIIIKNLYAYDMTMDQNIMIYAKDGQGWYFAEYDTEKDTMINKIYQDMGYMSSFAICNENNDFIYVSYNSSSKVLTYAKLGENNNEIELLPDFKNGSDIVHKYGNTYSKSLDSKTILRIKNSAYMYDNKPITLLSTENYQGYNPFGCGYQMKNVYKTEQELALAVLSQDSNYDLFFLDSNQAVADNIKNQGSFYPLNELKAVNDYLDACFPYIKEAATNEEGQIWMIPIRVDIPLILYNRTNCLNRGIQFPVGNLSFDLFQTLLHIASLEEANKELYSVNAYHLSHNLLNQYSSKYDKYDTNEFIKISMGIKEYLNYKDVDNKFGSDNIITNYYSNRTNDLMFLYARNLYELSSNTSHEDVRVRAVPQISGFTKNLAACHYISVNPNSKNLDLVLSYISELCQYLVEQDEMMMFVDKKIYGDRDLFDSLYSIYSNGEIFFAYPDDILKDDFDKYLLDEIDLNTLINNASRRMDIFKNE